MPTIVKGFITVNAFVNNTPGNISSLGELSTWSRTYSKEKGEYQYDDLAGFKLTTFKVADNTTGVQQVLNTATAKQIIQVARECVSYATSHIRPYDSIDFQNTILANFSTRVGNLQMGEFRDNGTAALPEWLSWTSLDNDNAIIKIWLSDPAFQDQYDEYEIVVLPPVDVVDHLFNEYNLALTEINSRTSAQFSDKLQILKGDNPETFLRIMDFKFVNRLNTAQSNKTTWAVVVYGKVGDNIDSIKDAIVEFVLASSTHSKSEWEIILPEIFKRTEFVLLPRWDKVSIENLGQLASLYSSAIEPNEAIAFAKNVISFYTDVFIENNITIFPYDYKALAIVAVNGNTNIPGFEKLFNVFPDYIPVPSTSSDFNRMKTKTQEWLILLEKLLLIAEVATVYTSVPLFARKQFRDGVLYISAMYDNVNYLVAAKSNSVYA